MPVFNLAYGYLKVLPRRTAGVLHWKGFNVAINAKYDGYQHEPTSMVYIFLL